MFLSGLFNKISCWYNGCSTAQKVVHIAEANLEAQKALLLPIAIETIKTAACTNLSGSEKLALCVSQLAARAPGIQTAMLTTFVQTTYEQLKADPNVPEVT